MAVNAIIGFLEGPLLPVEGSLADAAGVTASTAVTQLLADVALPGQVGTFLETMIVGLTGNAGVRSALGDQAWELVVAELGDNELGQQVGGVVGSVVSALLADTAFTGGSQPRSLLWSTTSSASREWPRP